VKGYFSNYDDLRLRTEEGHTEVTCAHDNVCECASKLPTAECPSGAKSGQFETHGCLPEKLQAYQRLACDASANIAETLRPYTILSSILFYYKNPLTGKPRPVRGEHHFWL
jgi:hypothetical protein